MKLPERIRAEIESGLGEIQESRARQHLRAAVKKIAAEAWERWIRFNGPQDNHPQHESTVFRLGMKIGVAEKLSLSELRVFSAFAFCHDNFKIKRIMDARVRDLEECGTAQEAAKLRREKQEQRTKHMVMGARRADRMLREIGVLSEAERERCAEIIRKHDCWKLGEAWPLWEDRLAVCCLEADALWPLQPLGVLADVERSGEDLADPLVWRQKAQESHGTMIVFRKNWDGKKEPFRDRKSIFRTAEGHKIYKEWCKFWSLRV